MNKLIIPLAVAIAILAVLAFTYLQRQATEPETLEPPAETGQPPPVVEEEEPRIRYPVPEIAPQREDQTQEDVGPEPAIQVDTSEEESPLPALDDSDAQLKEAIAAFVTERSLEALFRMDGFIRRLVVTIDNLPQKQLPRAKYRVNRSTSGRFAVRRQGEAGELSKEIETEIDLFLNESDEKPGP